MNRHILGSSAYIWFGTNTLLFIHFLFDTFDVFAVLFTNAHSFIVNSVNSTGRIEINSFTICFLILFETSFYKNVLS